MFWRRMATRLGRALLALGLLVLAFVAYELWGTGISTRLHQEQLRTTFDHELARARRAPQGTTPTTVPTRGVAAPVPGDVPADGQPVGTIDIPAIGARDVVVQGTDTADLELGPGHYAKTPLPGQPGNAAIAGHRTTYLRPFYDLNELTPGDPIYVTTTQGRFHYDVTRSLIVAPSDVGVLDPTPVPTLTLTTCNPRYSAAQRLVVQAVLVSPPAPAVLVSPSSPETSLVGRTSSPWPAVGWGAGCAALAVGAWALARRRRRWARAAVLAGGLLAFVVLLFFFFEGLSPLLPASF